MNDIHLCAALANLLDAELKDFMLPLGHEPNSEAVYRASKIFQGYLPPKGKRQGNSGNDDDFPFVVIRPDGGETNSDGCSSDVTLIFGVWDERFDGHFTAMTLKDRVEAILLNLPNQVLANRFILEMPISWENSPTQAWPFWQIVMKTRWTFHRPGIVNPSQDYE